METHIIKKKIEEIITKSVKEINDSKNISADLALVELGKIIRPLIFLNVVKFFKNKQVLEDDFLKIAAGLEMIHQFALIHDDIIDESLTRRGQPTLYAQLTKKYGSKGVSAAIIAGDALFSKALNVISQTEISKNNSVIISMILENAVKTACGQYDELIIENGSVNEDTIFDIYDKKTSYYTFVTPALTAALSVDVKKNEKEELLKASLVAGRIYQLNNDLKDITAQTDEGFDEPELNDLKQKKINMVYLILKKSVNESDESIFSECWQTGNRNVFKFFLNKYSIANQIKEKIILLKNQISDEYKAILLV